MDELAGLNFSQKTVRVGTKKLEPKTPKVQISYSYLHKLEAFFHKKILSQLSNSLSKNKKQKKTCLLNLLRDLIGQHGLELRPTSYEKVREVAITKKNAHQWKLNLNSILQSPIYHFLDVIWVLNLMCPVFLW